MLSMLLYMHLLSTLYLLVGWEYLGVLSYLLIQHWGSRPLAILGSAKALCYNRCTDGAVVLYTPCSLGLDPTESHQDGYIYPHRAFRRPHQASDPLDWGLQQ